MHACANVFIARTRSGTACLRSCRSCVPCMRSRWWWGGWVVAWWRGGEERTGRIVSCFHLSALGHLPPPPLPPPSPPPFRSPPLSTPRKMTQPSNLEHKVMQCQPVPSGVSPTWRFQIRGRDEGVTGWTGRRFKRRWREVLEKKKKLGKKNWEGKRKVEELNMELEGEKKPRYVLVKNKTRLPSRRLLLRQKGRREGGQKCLFFFFFFLLFKLVAQKTTNHIHKPLIGTVYLSKNIIELNNKKKNPNQQKN